MICFSQLPKSGMAGGQISRMVSKTWPKRSRKKSSVVRGLEKKAVNYGTKALRDIAEPAVDALADTAATALGNPELAAPLDMVINKGADYLQKRGADYLDQKIDASGDGIYPDFVEDLLPKGNGVRYMMPSGSGMRVAGSHTQIANGLRLASGSGMRMAGRGMRMAGSGHRVRPEPLEGAGHACGCS
eukprot:COSAG01_NODE_592_length_15109_cov_39.247435_1_plen_187_part_00